MTDDSTLLLLLLSLLLLLLLCYVKIQSWCHAYQQSYSPGEAMPLLLQQQQCQDC